MAADLGGRAERRRGQQRRRVVVIASVVGALVLMGAVAGAIALLTSKDEPSKRTAQTTRSTTTTSTSTTTTAPVPTTVVPKSPNPVVALAQQYDGYYVGTFSNTTFSTSGPVTLEVRIDPNANTLTVHATFDGDIFGGGAKEIRALDGTVKLGDPTAPVSTDTKSFGPVTARIDASLALLLSAPNIPDPKVRTFDLTGRLRDDHNGFDASYHVVFADEKTADGTVTVTCASNGQRPSEVRTLCTPT